MKSKAETRLIPVVLLTSLTSDADRIHGNLRSADDFLSKPVNKDELLVRANSLLLLGESLRLHAGRSKTRLVGRFHLGRTSYEVFAKALISAKTLASTSSLGCAGNRRSAKSP